jgi:hypothetical protein
VGKREFLMLAEEWDGESDVSGWWWSEKLDGQRAFWDGGVSRGLLATEVPWANTGKDARLLRPPVATGLWSRYGKVIHCPEWWTKDLPRMPLDLELWMGRGQFQVLRSVVGTHVGSEGWRAVKGWALDCPSWLQVFERGEINNTNWPHFNVEPSVILPWVEKELGVGAIPTAAVLPADAFERLKLFLGQDVDPGNALWKGDPRFVVPLMQRQLPQRKEDAVREALKVLAERTRDGAEGLVLRHPSRGWCPKRVRTVLKAKPAHDMEGTVVGFTWGRRTAKGSRLLGRMGALVLRLDNGLRLELSGFTDDERAVKSKGPDNKEWETLEGKDATDAWDCVWFPRGSRVTFVYREKSLDGIPKEARYLRRRDDR